MFKFMVSGLVAVAAVVMPAPVAAHPSDFDPRVERSIRGDVFRDRGRGRGISRGEAIAIWVAPMIIGSMIANGQERRAINRFDGVVVLDSDLDFRTPSRVFNRNRNCRQVVTSGVDRFGNYYRDFAIRC